MKLFSMIFRVLLVVLPIALCSQVSAALESHPLPITKYPQQTLLKNWALSMCFAQITSDAKAIKDASTTAGAYFEYGKQNVEVYDELRAIVRRFLALKYGAKPEIGEAPVELNTMKCVDLFYSDELNELTRKLVKNRPK